MPHCVLARCLIVATPDRSGSDTIGHILTPSNRRRSTSRCSRGSRTLTASHEPSYCEPYYYYSSCRRGLQHAEEQILAAATAAV